MEACSDRVTATVIFALATASRIWHVSLIRRIKGNPEIVNLLVHPFDFDLERPYWVGEEETLRSGRRMEAVAGTASGDGYFFCGEAAKNGRCSTCRATE